MKRKWIVAGAVCACLVAGLLFIRYQQRKAQEAQAAKAIEELSLGLSTDERHRFWQVRSKALHDRKLSDTDLDWLLALLESSTNELFEMQTLPALELLGDSTPSQKEKIRIAIAPYRDPNNSRYNSRYENVIRRIDKWVLNR
jgi:hypothetical protein